MIKEKNPSNKQKQSKNTPLLLNYYKGLGTALVSEQALSYYILPRSKVNRNMAGNVISQTKLKRKQESTEEAILRTTTGAMDSTSKILCLTWDTSLAHLAAVYT